ncbi:MAG: NusG domain II-containing protein [Ruminococcus sp.]|nr:NusG domain II-containing protein [Ruminococcus sp.]
MKTKKYILIIICILIFIFGITGSIFMILKPHGKNVQIIQDGEILYTIDLDSSGDRTIITEYNGNKNIISIRNHQIFMEDAECSDHTCIKMGVLESYASPIVCLPNKIIIRFADN